MACPPERRHVWPRHVLGSFQVGNYLRPERSAGSVARVSGGLQEADRGRI